MNFTRPKNFKLLFASYFLILIFISPYSHTELTDSDWNKLYNSILTCIKNNAWEEARARLMYFKDVINTNRAYDKFPDLKELETEVAHLVDNNLNILYQKGLNLFQNRKIDEAYKIFTKNFLPSGI
ncbi:hypothetical protein J7K25_02820 [bacterium]|nr:hypothetical protein [bacterium]